MRVLSDPSPRWEPFVIVLLLLAASAAAQTPPPRDPARPVQVPTRDRAPVRTTGTGVVKGKVVDGVTASPIARARVRLMGGPNGRGPVLTDGEGSFTFTGLAPGQVQVMVEKSTYLPGRHPDMSRSLRGRFPQNHIADGQVLDVTVRMFRGGVIAGRVTDSYGDPVDFAQVQVLLLPRGRPPQQRGGASTNDLGEFRVPRLEPGRYVLSIVPRNPMTMDDPSSGMPAPPLPQATPVYYPAVASPDQSQAIVINRGETVSGIEIVLGEALPTVVSGTVVGPDGLMNKIGGSVMARISTVASNLGPPMSSTPIRNDGTFRMQLVPGQYTLEARANPQTGPGEVYQASRELFGTMQLSLGAGQTESVMIMLGKGATASGRITFEGTSPVPAAPVGRPMRPPVFSENGECRTGEAAVAADWTFKIEGLMGTCGVPPANIFGRWTLKSVRIGGVNALEKQVTFEQGRNYNDVEIVVTDKPTQLEVRVAGEDGQLTCEYVALAFPSDKTLWKQGPRVIRNLVPAPMNAIVPSAIAGSIAATGGQSRELIRGMLPGEYYVISLDDIDNEDSLDPGVLEKLAVHATRVTVAPESSSEVSLQRLKIADIIR
jgi:hypothetical protein